MQCCLNNKNKISYLLLKTLLKCSIINNIYNISAREADSLKMLNNNWKIEDKFISRIAFIVGGLLFICAGLCFLVSDIKSAVDLKLFLSYAVKTTAVVKDVSVYYDKNPNHHDIYTTTFEFEADGKIYTGQTKSMDFEPEWEKSTTIEIYYDTVNPYDTYVYNKNDMGYKVFSIGIGAALLAAGIFLLAYQIKSSRQSVFKE